MRFRVPKSEQGGLYLSRPKMKDERCRPRGMRNSASAWTEDRPVSGLTGSGRTAVRRAKRCHRPAPLKAVWFATIARDRAGAEGSFAATGGCWHFRPTNVGGGGLSWPGLPLGQDRRDRGMNGWAGSCWGMRFFHWQRRFFPPAVKEVDRGEIGSVLSCGWQRTAGTSRAGAALQPNLAELPRQGRSHLAPIFEDICLTNCSSDIYRYFHPVVKSWPATCITGRPKSYRLPGKFRG